MTTIAVRDGIMAADTRGTVNGLIFEARKLHRVFDSIVGIAGNAGDGGQFVDWLRGGGDMKAPPAFVSYNDQDGPDFDALVLDAGGVTLWTQYFQPLKLLGPYFAIGSGAMAAMAAMEMGADAETAVAIAMKVDLHTGGDVEVEGLDSET